MGNEGEGQAFRASAAPSRAALLDERGVGSAVRRASPYAPHGARCAKYVTISSSRPTCAAATHKHSEQT